MTRSTLQALIGRLEKATGPDRDLSDAVLFSCGWRVNYSAEQIAEVSDEDRCDLLDNACWYPPGEPLNWIHGFKRPDPVASIDAALTLVPEGWGWSVCHYDRCTANAFLHSPSGECLSFPAQTAPIALCIATLRARLASEGE